MTRAASGRWRQLALPFPYEPQFSAADFLAAASNAEALAWLAPATDWPQRRLALWGPGGSGKTHLLHLWAARTGAALLAGPLLPAVPAPPERPLAIDDADTAAERPLLHALNAAAEAGQPVLLAARAAPARWPTALPDLASRLRAIAAVEIRPPEESLLHALLARLLAERQLAVEPAVQDWLSLRLPRTAAAMREAAARLDRAALVAGRRVSLAIARDVLAAMEHDAARPRAGADDEDFAASPPPGSTAAPCLL